MQLRFALCNQFSCLRICLRFASCKKRSCVHNAVKTKCASSEFSAQLLKAFTDICEHQGLCIVSDASGSLHRTLTLKQTVNSTYISS